KLADKPIRITLFEASNRLGGKILTPQFQKASVKFEAGAAEFYDYSQHDEDPLKLLISELGLSISPMAGSAVIANNQVLSNLDDIRNHFGANAYQSLVEFDRIARDWMTPQEFHESDYPDGANQKPGLYRFDSLLAEIEEPSARKYIEDLIHSDLATEPSQTSIAYGLQNYVMNNGKYMDLYSIEGGNEQLPRALAARINANVLLNHPVSRIDKSTEGSWNVQTIHAGKTQTHEFDYVVIALPHNHLSSLTFGGERLKAAVDKHYGYYHYPAHYLRVTILFDRPFWRGRLTDSFWMLDHFGGCCLYDESSREPESKYGVLGWLMAGSAAEELSALDDEQLIELALDSLPDFLPDGRVHFLEGHVYRWLNAVNAMPSGLVPRRHDQRHQPEPDEHPELFLVGDYLFDSTLNGVLDSANYVAAWIATNISDTL
ncbi:MAG: flavin monoamine oxidase family protein, partial [Pirellula sp.]